MKKRGILIAVSSLPGKYGIGDFSDEAIKFINILKKNRINVWQILPLNPVGYGYSPYQPFSSHVFDEIYISIEDLQKRDLIGRVNKVKSTSMVDYEKSRNIKNKIIYEAFLKFSENPKNIRDLNRFLKNNPYVEEYATFITLKEFNDSKSWDQWTIFEKDSPEDFEFNKAKHGFAQMMLFKQWSHIKKIANNNGIEIIGDVPFYVGYDSSDVYFHKDSFLLDENFNPTKIAGVPPDYFSKDGQRWGNPIWNWDLLYTNEFKAIIDRLETASKFYDIIRLDHFRAFDSYWAINPSCPTAVDGKWEYPNGDFFFNTLYRKFPNINIIAEDLGELRPEVLELRDRFDLPGMRLLEFTIFDDELNNKHVEKENQIYYITTHDNETLSEWLNKMDFDTKMKLRNRINELGFTGNSLSEKLIKYSLNRKEKMIILTAQDIMHLDKKHRMNKPGIIDEFNWRFKLIDFKNISKSIRKYYL